MQLQLHYTTLHPAVVGEVTTATIATTPKTQLQPPFGPSVDSLCHPWFTTTNLPYRFPIFETSATALRSTTGMNVCMYEWMNEWMTEWMDDWLTDWLSEWMNEWMNEWRNEGMNEWTNERMHEWTNERMNEWTNERMTE